MTTIGLTKLIIQEIISYQQNKKKQKELISYPLIEQLKILNYLNTAVCIVISYNFLTIRKDSNI